jgi:stearoyl-CoA desaturase (delta-9 desaturase)
MGEGYHNFHHQFPMDYRNAFLWYQYDPTKWFIALCATVGLANNLKRFPSNEIAKGRLAMKLKDLKKIQDGLDWPLVIEELPVVSWETCKYMPYHIRRTLMVLDPVYVQSRKSANRGL